jgi:hypothetical protein
VKQGRGAITLGQSAYARKLLEKVGMKSCNLCHVPMEVRLKLSTKGTTEEVDAMLYHSLVGSLQYLVHTWLDISFAMGYVSRFIEKPRQEHLVAVKHLLCYIAGIVDYGIIYSKFSKGVNKLMGYSDSDLQGDIDDRMSTIRVILFMGEMPISWQSHKQKVVALSTCEGEYMAVTPGLEKVTKCIPYVR